MTLFLWQYTYVKPEDVTMLLYLKAGTELVVSQSLDRTASVAYVQKLSSGWTKSYIAVDERTLCQCVSITKQIGEDKSAIKWVSFILLFYHQLCLLYKTLIFAWLFIDTQLVRSFWIFFQFQLSIIFILCLSYYVIIYEFDENFNSINVIKKRYNSQWVLSFLRKFGERAFCLNDGW